MKKNLSLIRSLLYTPGLKVQDPLYTSNVQADALLIELEDSVPASQKTLAQERVKQYFEQAHPEIITCIRMNDVKTEEGLSDLAYFVTLANSPDILLLPKVNGHEEIMHVRKFLSEHGLSNKIFLTIETPESIFNLADLAKHSDGFVFGASDFCAELCINPEWESLLHARQSLVTAAAIDSIPVIDTPCLDLSHNQALIDEAHRSKSLGFTGKVAITPEQVPIINPIFSIDESEIAYAKKVISAYEEAGGGMFTLEGKIIGHPMYLKAQKLLRRYQSER